MNRLTTCLTITTLALSSGAFAMDESKDDSKLRFDALDQNNNGTLEEVEVYTAQDAAQNDLELEDVNFNRLDTDEDGEVDETEWVTYFENN